jgi:two-component system cell cycle response regulator
MHNFAADNLHEDTVRRVLLVEDNPGDARLLREFLSDTEAMQFEIVRAERLAQALELVGRQPFDVALLDLSLPDAHGLETFETLCHHAPELPIVVLTGLDDDEISLKAVQLGAQDYLVKGQVTTALIVRSIRYAVERHRMQTALRNLSLVDELTGLYNRRGFLTLAEQQLKAAQRNGTLMTMFFADLDGMKTINDTYGHPEGDWALQRTADVLRQTFRESDILARLGGDEFTVLASMKPQDDAESVLQRLQARANALNAQKLRPFEVRISVGSASFEPKTLHSIDELMGEADKVLNEVKRLRKKARLRDSKDK